MSACLSCSSDTSAPQEKGGKGSSHVILEAEVPAGKHLVDIKSHHVCKESVVLRNDRCSLHLTSQKNSFLLSNLSEQAAERDSISRRCIWRNALWVCVRTEHTKLFKPPGVLLDQVVKALVGREHAARMSAKCPLEGFLSSLRMPSIVRRFTSLRKSR